MMGCRRSGLNTEEKQMKIPRPLATAAVACAFACTGCVAVPVGPEGQLYFYPPGVPPGAIPIGGPDPYAHLPAVLQARLYPSNDAAAQVGVVVGTVTNMMTGK